MEHGPRRWKRLVGRMLGMALAFLVAVAAWPALPLAAQAPEVLQDFPVPNGHFYSQASGAGPRFGYTITNDEGIAFWDEFERLGGVPVLGYPNSGRFEQGGFVYQSTQKALLQWRPETGRVAFANVFDMLSDAGLDGWLQRQRLIPPPFDNTPDAVLDWPAVVARHLALLDVNPAIRQVYFASSDPITHYGLPQSYADYGGVFVVRAQRAAFQQWRILTPFALPGQVTIVNGGDLLKEAGLLPRAAAQPQPAAGLLVAPPGPTLRVDPQTVQAARAAAERAGPAVVRILAQTATGMAEGSGFFIDPAGRIVTNNHVVSNARRIDVQLADGTRVGVAQVAADQLTDIAVLTLAQPVPRAAVLPVGSAGELVPGSVILGIGYSPHFPAPPTIRIGRLQGSQPDVVTYLRSDLYILPGDSGGPLLNLRGEAIGINTAIQISRLSREPISGLSIDLQNAQPLIAELITNGRIARPYIGVRIYTVTPELAARLNLRVTSGVIVADVIEGSPAEAAGIREGDVIVAIGGTEIRSVRDVSLVLSRYRPGDTVTVRIVPPLGQPRTVTLTLAQQP